MNIGNYKVTEPLYESNKFIIYRGIRLKDGCSVLLKLLKNEHPDIKDISALKHEAEMLSRFQGKCSFLTLETFSYNHAFVIVLEDFGGTTLDKILNNYTFDTVKFLETAIQITEALQKVHDAGIVHGKINPYTIFVNLEKRTLKLMGFEDSIYMSSSVAPDFLYYENIKMLQYISPEQTGKIESPIDFRSDLYSLGIVFYQMLSGKPPFVSNNRMEILHQHLVSQPFPLYKLNSNIPLILSDIISKLISKRVEERYQTVHGLAADLYKCLESLRIDESSAVINDFILGQDDAAAGFNIPIRLYGRDTEIKELISCYDKITKGGFMAIVIDGYSGVGKTAFVNHFKKHVIGKRGFFISCKFDQYMANEPMSSIIQPLKIMIKNILSESEDVIELWKSRIIDALAENSQLMVNIIPELKLIIGNQPAVSKLPPQERRKRFYTVFFNFVQLFTSDEKPLVIFMDDIQWADPLSLQLIEYMLKECPLKHVLLIGAMRSNEVDSEHPLNKILAKDTKDLQYLKRIHLDSLSSQHVYTMLSETFNSSIEEVMPLANICIDKTEGNPFFLIQFILSLKEEGMIRYGFSEKRWIWDLDRIKEKRVSENVVELVVNKIRKLPQEVLDLLTTASFLEIRFEVSTLSTISKKNEDEILTLLTSAVKEGIVTPVSESDTPAYSFLHDRIQQAFQTLLGSDEKELMHYNIGKLIYESLNENSVDARIYEIVNHLNNSSNICISKGERLFLIELNLQAGKKALSSSAYEKAMDYLSFGISLLSDSDWEQHYDTALELCVEAAETAYICTHFQEMDKICDMAIAHVKSQMDQARILETRILAYTSMNNLEKALDTARYVLRLLGINIPKNPNWFHIIFMYIRTRLALLSKKTSKLTDIPLMADPRTLMIMRVMNSASMASYSSCFKTTILFAFHGTLLSLKYGNAEESCVAYSGYGYIIYAFLGKAEAAYEFGRTSIVLMKKLGVKHMESRVLLNYNMVIRHGKEPLRNTLNDFPQNYLSGFSSGDLISAGHNLMQYFVYSYYSGAYLDIIINEIHQHMDAIWKTKHKTSTHLCMLYMQVALNLKGEASDPCILKGEYFDEDEILSESMDANDHTVIFNIYFNKMILHYYFGMPEKAIDYIQLSEKYIDGVIGTFCIPLFLFYSTLIMIDNYSTFKGTEKSYYRRRIKKNIHIMNRLSRSAPNNILNKLFLMKAEWEKTIGNSFFAADYYSKAIDYAGKNMFLQEQALACEKAAMFFHKHGSDSRMEDNYLRDAYNYYKQWGANAIVENMKNRFSGNNIPYEKSLSKSYDTRLMSVIKAVQAISSEIVLEELIKLLVEILLQESGAQRAVFIMKDKDRLKVEAEGNSDNQITIMQSLPIYEYEHIPQKIINYVERTHETVSINDVFSEHLFTNDIYFENNHPKSAVCIPIVAKRRLLGILYLENNLLSNAFTVTDVEILNILSSQIAISLENALIYKNTEQIIENRTKEIEDKNTHLRELNEKLIAADETKNRFVANISHELRTPLHGIIGMTSLIKKNTINSRVKEYADMIDTSAKTLLGIINDVLDISKIEASKMILQEKRFSIRQLALEVINLLKLKADSKGIRLTCNISDEIPEYLMGDPLRIRQILFNLLGNSVKFTEHGVVEISAELLESDLSTVKLLFKVKDTGIGIPEERLNVIFEEFTQSDPSITQKYGGTGLGLTIVKKLVNLMGGSISVESSVNVGSLFQFELILGKAVPSDTSDKVERQDFNRFSEEYLELKPMKIAVAEDNIINQKYIASLLKYYGFEVALAENGKEVINLISQNYFDCIIMDKNMPEMDGIEATKAIREMEKETSSHIPIIALTASSVKNDTAKLLASGVDYYLYKPIDESELLNILSRIAAAKNVNPKYVDFAALKEQAKLFGRDIFIEMIDELLNSGKKVIDELKELIDLRDYKQLRFYSHKLAGSIANLYAPELSKLVRKLELKADNQNLEDAEADLEQFIPSFHGFIEELREIRNILSQADSF